MKATGIVRRIDDLGRVVIPKEIRRTLRIREGDPLEIYTDRDGEVIFKKYSPMGEMGAVSAELAEAMARTAGMSCAICGGANHHRRRCQRLCRICQRKRGRNGG